MQRFAGTESAARGFNRVEDEAMEPVVFVMAILGCDDGGMACRQERIEPVRYESVAQCRAAMQGALARNADLDYPVVGASCMRNGERFADRVPNPGAPRS